MIVRCSAAIATESCAVRLLVALIVSLPGAEAAAQARLSPEDCRLVTEHVPDPSVAHRPGVGVGGRRVAPADLAPPPAVVPAAPQIYLGVDLQRRYGLPPDLKAELPLGILSFDGTRLLLNGLPLTPPDQAALAAACSAARPR
jgi:hypothetical protein